MPDVGSGRMSPTKPRQIPLSMGSRIGDRISHIPFRRDLPLYSLLLLRTLSRGNGSKILGASGRRLLKPRRKNIVKMSRVSTTRKFVSL